MFHLKRKSNTQACHSCAIVCILKDVKLAISVLIIVGIYFIYQFTVGSIFRKYQSCYDTAAVIVSEIDTTQTNACIIEKLTYTEMNGCIQDIQQENNFSAFLYEASGAKKSVDADISNHNEKCPSNEIDPPGEAFYLSAGASR